MKINNHIIEADFLKIPDATKYWFVRASSKAEYYRDFKLNNFIAIGDNEIKLSSLFGIPQKYKISEETLKEKYKQLFNEEYITLLQASTKYKNLEKSEQADEIEKTKRSSTIAATKTFSFVEEMGIGDFILVPYKSSEVFLIGIVISDVFDDKIDHEYIGLEDEYPISDYEKKRRVFWIKEISQDELPEKLLWIQTGQRAIFDITKNADDINPILSNEYIYKGNAHIRINVGTPNKISSSDWLQYQLLINQNSEDKADEIFQKNKVQSIGHTILETAIDNWKPLLTVGAALFTEVDFEVAGQKFKTHGPLSFLIPGSKERKKREKKKEDLEIEKQAELVNGIKLDNEAKKIENQKNQIILEQLKNRPDLTDQTEDCSNESLIIKRTSEEIEAIENMRITQKTIGSEISSKTQTVIQNLEILESETTKEQ